MKSKKFPFFISVDDGGFPFVQDDISEQKTPIPFTCYETLVKIAKEFNLRIPVAFTMKYLDINVVSGLGKPLSYAKKLIKFLKENKEYIEIAYHGLTHNWKGGPEEFSEKIPEKAQKEHVEKSEKIFDSLSWTFPEIFIPPYHRWEPGVTDKILKDFGTKYIVTSPPRKSAFLKVFPRGLLGIFSDDLNLSEDDIDRVRNFITPTSFFYNLRYHHRLMNKPFHSYITHLGNFTPSSSCFWEQLLGFIKKGNEFFLVSNNQEAVKMVAKKN